VSHDTRTDGLAETERPIKQDRELFAQDLSDLLAPQVVSQRSMNPLPKI
jgi:hypothetical protein